MDLQQVDLGGFLIFRTNWEKTEKDGSEEAKSTADVGFWKGGSCGFGQVENYIPQPGNSCRDSETAKEKEVEEPGTLELEVPIENTSQTQAGPNSKPSLKEE